MRVVFRRRQEKSLGVPAIAYEVSKREESLVKRDTSYVIKRAEHFKSILTAEGFLVGIVAGLVVLLYRVLLEYAGRGMNLVLEYGRSIP